MSKLFSLSGEIVKYSDIQSSQVYARSSYYYYITRIQIQFTAMAISLCFTPLTSNPKQHPRIPLYKSIKPITLTSPKILSPNLKTIIKCVPENSQNLAVIPAKPRWEIWLSTAANLFPVYVTVGGVVACLKPSTFSWFVNSGPTSYSLALWFIMLAMGLTLEVKELLDLLLQRPLSVSTLFL